MTLPRSHPDPALPVSSNTVLYLNQRQNYWLLNCCSPMSCQGGTFNGARVAPLPIKRARVAPLLSDNVGIAWQDSVEIRTASTTTPPAVLLFDYLLRLQLRNRTRNGAFG